MHQADAAPLVRPALSTRLVEGCRALRGHRLPWLAVAFGAGVGAYFALPVEPGRATLMAGGWLVLMFGWLAWWLRTSVGIVPLLLAVLLAGALVAQLRTMSVAGPVLGFRYYGAVEGRVVAIDRSASGAVRVTLDRVRLDRMAPERTPRRVRLSLQTPPEMPLEPGARVMTTAHLLPPSGPTEPGGFDFQRHAFFLKLGAVGYTRVPVLLAGPGEAGWATTVERARLAVAAALRARMPGQAGEVAAAITTGDRSGLSPEVTGTLRASNLAHLLAISGLHMGLLVGFVFWALRGAFALIPRVALTQPTRAWAALAAFPFAVAYLFLSGGGVATQRAFIMAAVMLGAVVLGRRALSIRSVAIAAILVLLWRPESLTGPGFQMSFAATGALVLAFGALNQMERPAWRSGWRGSVFALVVSSAVAGLATAPIAALHFNRIAHFGLIANLLAVPVMGAAVMPLLFLGLLLMPLGLEALPLAVAGWGIEWILMVAERVTALPGAVRAVPAPHWVALPLLGLGFGVFAAARGAAARAVAVAAGIGAATVWGMSGRPDVLISYDARLIGVATPEGRWLSRDSGVAFVATSWLENDGDLASQEAAAARDVAMPLPIHHAAGKRGLDDAVRACAAEPGWLVVAVTPDAVPRGCRLIDPESLSRTGAIALSLRDGRVEMRTARDVQGARPWAGGG
ncbi:ComEC/Rec2 family competence protein [Jannaschia marina]|uniref:ComEC/Rec2 family competence protein n=1 Tax=Jannaschia marina TaxID=2741674 RepID=UPI0015C86E3E|nr:ComEC/Rec2 family competence protein [Jannaschia marina]